MAPPDELDDLTLLRAQRGDQDAFRALMVHYQRPVFALLGRMLARTHGADLIEDLAQESFLKVFRALPGFSPRKNSDRAGRDGRAKDPATGQGSQTGPAGTAKLSTWILTITTRVALDELRKYAPPTEPIEEIPGLAGALRTEERAERRSLGEELERAVSALPVHHRAVFLLREFHDLSYEEIAEVTGIEVGTVKSRLLRARSALRVALAGLLDA